MRLRKKNLKKYYLKNRIISKDSEGNTIVTYSSPIQIKAEIWSAGGTVQAEIYGEKLGYIKNAFVKGKYIVQTEKSKVKYILDGFTLSEGDGVCVCSSSDLAPDYKIIAVREYSNLYLELEKVM